MKFQVPQYIEVEDKIVGPLTLKQFIYIAGGVGLSFIIYRFLPLFIAILLIAPVALLSFSLAFYKINNKPFIDVIESFFKYFVGSKLYIWKKVPKKIEEVDTTTSYNQVEVPALNQSKLKDLMWNLGVKQSQEQNLKDTENSLS